MAHFPPLIAGAPISLTVYFHPLSSFCQKVVLALYELEVPFTKRIAYLADEGDRRALEALWALAKFSVLHDEARDVVTPESSRILEYVELPLARHRELARYFARLLERPSFMCVLEEARPYWPLFPG